MNLRIPGPTPLPPAVKEAMVAEIPGHRSKAFAQTLAEVGQLLKPIFGTEGDVLVLTGSGTGGLEAAVANLLSPGQPALFVSIGTFGERWAKIAEAYGAEVVRLDFPPGAVAAPEAVADALRADARLRTLFLTHSETSTGALNDVRGITAAARAVRADVVVAVDGVSSVGAVPLATDAWGLDLVVTASQKALMGPPGLALIAVAPRGLEAIERAAMPRFYWDLRRARRDAAENHTSYTPAVQDLLGLRAGLGLLHAEGLANAFARHDRLGRMARQGLRELGFLPLAEEGHASPTVTAAWVPEGLSGTALRRRLEEKQVYISPGHVKDRTIRIAHMGWVSEDDVAAALAALSAAAMAERGETR